MILHMAEAGSPADPERPSGQDWSTPGLCPEGRPAFGLPARGPFWTMLRGSPIFLGGRLQVVARSGLCSEDHPRYWVCSGLRLCPEGQPLFCQWAAGSGSVLDYALRAAAVGQPALGPLLTMP